MGKKANTPRICYAMAMQHNIPQFDPYEFTEVKVGNARIFYKHLPWAPCIHVNFSFDVGAFHDPVGKEGVAHFLEHMLGNGSPLLPDRKAMKEFSRQYMLSSRNAGTSYYRTSYTGRLLPEHFEKVVTTMYDYVFHSYLRPEDVEHERKVITEEAWGRYKNEKLLSYIQEFNKNMYPGHPRERISSPLGWPQTVLGIKREDLADFYKKHYIAENLTVFVVGAVTESHIEALSQVLAQTPTGTKEQMESHDIPVAEIKRFERNSEDIGDPKKQLEFSIMRASTDIGDEMQYIAWQARRLLQDTLFERLRTEKSLCYGVSVGSRRYKDYFEGGVHVETSIDHLALVEKEIWQVVQEITAGAWESRFNTLHQIILDQIRSEEHISADLIEDVVHEYNIHGKITTKKELLQQTERVTHAEVVDFMKTLFDPEKVITEVIFPKTEHKA